MSLEFERIFHQYDATEAVRDFSLTVAAGEVVCLVGPSGCGKSTILRLAAGLEALQSGRIIIEGRTVAGGGHDDAPEQRQVGLVFQDYALFPHLSVLENVMFGMREGREKDRRAAARTYLDRLSIANLQDSYPHSLSGGEQQRVALARALAAKPQVMLLDEPFSGLDINLRDRVREDTLKLLREAGTPVLLVTHDPEEAMSMADRIAVMRGGAVQQFGIPSEIYDQPNNKFVAEFFGNINELPCEVNGEYLVSRAGTFALQSDDQEEEQTIAFRNEAVTIVDGDCGVPATVDEARLLGPSVIVALSLAGGEKIQANIPSKTLPRIGEKVHIKIDSERVFVFSA